MISYVFLYTKYVLTAVSWRRFESACILREVWCDACRALKYISSPDRTISTTTTTTATTGGRLCDFFSVDRWTIVTIPGACRGLLFGNKSVGVSVKILSTRTGRKMSVYQYSLNQRFSTFLRSRTLWSLQINTSRNPSLLIIGFS